jgi:hypothetical protein
MDKTEKRADIIADTLTIAEIGFLAEGLRYWLNLPGSETSPYFSDVYATRRLMLDALTSAETNEYAGDYDYPEDAA